MMQSHGNSLEIGLDMDRSVVSDGEVLAVCEPYMYPDAVRVGLIHSLLQSGAVLEDAADFWKSFADIEEVDRVEGMEQVEGNVGWKSAQHEDYIVVPFIFIRYGVQLVAER